MTTSLMDTESIIKIEDAFQLPTYNKLPIALERGEGSYVWDTDGNRYLDFYGGHCVTLLGHCPPRVVKAIQQQAEQLIFYSNVVYSPIRARAAELLTSMAPEGMRHAFFCNSGTEANETALKLARGFTGKSGIIAMEAGFHGRSLGSLAVTGIDKYRAPYQRIMPDTQFLTFGDTAAVEAALKADDNIAALILEPIQSMAGVTEASTDYYKGLRDLCTEYDVVLIFDEVQTGVGRTGTFSISEQYGIKPDIITMAKSLASGMPIGALLASDAIAAIVKSGDQGTTFGGGMLAMASLVATIETIKEENLMERAHVIFDKIASGVRPHVKAVRGRGCLIGIELDGPVAPVIKALRERGILTGGSMNPNAMRMMPPINTSDEDIAFFLEAFQEC